jgi:hypothetical protein
LGQNTQTGNLFLRNRIASEYIYTIDNKLSINTNSNSVEAMVYTDEIYNNYSYTKSEKIPISLHKHFKSVSYKHILNLLKNNNILVTLDHKDYKIKEIRGSIIVLDNNKSLRIDEIKNIKLPVPMLSPSTNNIKPGVAELFKSNPELANAVYSAMGLTTINESEITYTDEDGNPCAKMGLTNATKGTGWKIVKDFKGQPKHSQGGVDIIISDKGVTIRRGGKDIKAAHGLLIPAIVAADGLILGNEDKDPQKGVSKYTPTKGHKQGDVYKTDDRIINELKTIYKLSSLYDDPQAFIKSKLPTVGKNIHANMLTDRHLLGTFKYSRAKDTDNRKYTSIYNYNPIGKSFYDRIYDDEIEKYDIQNKDVRDYTRKLYELGAIKPYKDGWEYKDISKIDSYEPKGNREFIRKWYNSPEAEKRYIDSGGKKEDWISTREYINKNLNSVKVVKPKYKIPKMYVGEGACYSPYYNTVIDHMGDNYTHELVHGTKISNELHMSKLIKDAAKKYTKTDKSTGYDYSPSEVHSRVMDIRHKYDIKPNEVITKERLKKIKEDNYSSFFGKYREDLFNNWSDDGIIYLLNTLAQNNNKNNNKNNNINNA